MLKSGLKLKTALCLNFMSALTSFAGLYLGIALATTEIARQWIFAVTAGMFLYVALADMVSIVGVGDYQIVTRVSVVVSGIFTTSTVLVLHMQNSVTP